MADLEVAELPKNLHEAMLEWQKRNFEDYPILVKHWSKFYPNEQQFVLNSKLGALRSEMIEVGKLKGNKKFSDANAMGDEMLTRAGKIIKAQCSTELGSIQQHRGSLQKATDAKLQFDVLRVMAEELRHAYQMMFVLANDRWGSRNLAEEMMEELLSMRTGGHVLDAFNLYFDSFVDNITFAAIIDRVGKYQLMMQQAFSYIPMARSMGPMLKEEAFHLKTGCEPLKVWAREAVTEKGNVTIPIIQKHINKWVPRGLEMFGKEAGGQDAVEFGFKDMLNSDAMARYFGELKSQVVDAVNVEIVKTRKPTAARDEALQIAERILKNGEKFEGLAAESILYLPSNKFFRRRGNFAFEMNDVNGNAMSDRLKYFQHLRSVLPEPYIVGPDFDRYVKNLVSKQEGKDVSEEPLPFYG